MLRIRPLALVYALALLPAFVQCSSSSSTAASSGTVTTGEYKGLLTSTGGTGILDVNLASGSSTASLRTEGATATFTATGTITMVSDGSVITLTGTFDPSTGNITLTGTGFSLTGTASGSSLSGSYTGPTGSGSFSLLPATSGAVTLYCGTYAGDATGNWNIAVDASGSALGNHCDGHGCGVLSGSVSGASVSLGDPTDPATTATGSITGKSLTGTWAGTQSSKGTWQGSQDACGAAAVTPVGGMGDGG